MKNRPYFKIYSFIIFFFTLWIIRQFLYIEVDTHLEGLIKVLCGIIIKIIIWIGFTCFYLKCIYKTNPFQFFKLKISKKGIIFAFIFAFALLALNIIRNLLFNDYVFLSSFSIKGFMTAVIFAPIIEELVFRGFILEKLSRIHSFLFANFITSILFMCIHFPGWIIWGDGFSYENALSIFAVSLIWGYLYKKTNSLWTSITAHALNNLISMFI
jgi:uncharacterized protein